MIQLLNKVLGRVEYISSRNMLNLWKTIWVNFRSLPFSQAIKFPIFVYGGLKIMSLEGKIIIKAPIKRGMIKFGDPGMWHMRTARKSVLQNISQITFHGSASFFSGFRLQTSSYGTITFGSDICTNVNATIIAGDDIIIGDKTRFSVGVIMMNNDVHYIADMNKKRVVINHAPIIIGAHNWITSDVKVMKGCITPDWTIVLGNSLINKDYTKTISESSIIGGQPAKLIAEGMRRVFSLETETEIRKYFSETDAKIFNILENTNFDKFCQR